MIRNNVPQFPIHVPMALGVLALVLLLGGSGFWAGHVKLAAAVIASGRIEVDARIQVVQHPDGGVISEVLVRDGMQVSADQVLIRLDPSTLLSQLAIIEAQLFDTMARRGLHEAERDGRTRTAFDPILVEAAVTRPDVAMLMQGQSQLLEARAAVWAREAEQLAARRTQIRMQIEGLSAQQGALRLQLDLIARELMVQQDLLDRGLAQAGRVLALQREQARLTGQIGALTADMAMAEGRITEAEIENLRLSEGRREDAMIRLRDLQLQERELAEQRRAVLERLDRLDIRAPVAGLVHGLQVFSRRAVLRPADVVLQVVPQDSPMAITARLGPLHVDRVHAGQAVTVRFSALDYPRTPEVEGRVAMRSADAFADPATGAAFFQVRIELDAAALERLPEGATLIPGMPVDAFIRTGEHTVLEYLLRPFTAYFVAAMRES